MTEHRQASSNEPTPALVPAESLRDALEPGEPVLEASRALDPLRHLGSFTVLEELGRGGMGVVYKARDARLFRIVALKVLDGFAALDETRAERFRREARACAKLRHPNIVSIFEVGEELDVCYIAMELVEGVTLAQRMRDGCDIREVARVLERVAEALEHAHWQGVVHRDVKPANILLDRFGAPRLCDFGLALDLSARDARLTSGGAIVGTPAYMAPEQVRGGPGDVGPGADIHALGAILYEVLAGRPPFDAPTVHEVLTRLERDEPEPPSRSHPWTTPRALERVCMKCLEKEPTHRYPFAADVAADLRRFLAGEVVHARPRSLARRALAALRARRHVASALVLLVIGLLLGGAAWRERNGRAAAERRVQAEQDLHEAVARAEEGIQVLETWGRRPHDRAAGEVGLARVRNEVAADLARGREAHPEHPDLLVAEARYAVLRGDPVRALAVLTRARATGVAPTRAHDYVLGWALLKEYGRGREEPAVHLVHAASARAGLVLERLPVDTPEQAALARAGQAALRAYLDRGPPDVRAWRARLGFAFLGGRFDEVLALYSAGDAEDEQVGYDMEARWLAAKALFYVAVETPDPPARAAKLEQARLHAEALASRLADSPEYWSWRGLIEHAADDPVAAIRSCDRALDLDPRYAAAARNRGFAHRCVADTRRAQGLSPDASYAAALADYTRSLELNPRLAVAAYDRGVVHQALADGHQVGDLEIEARLRAALADFDRALTLDPLFKDAHVGRANTLERLGEVVGAVSAYETALGLGPDPLIETRLRRLRGGSGE